MQFTTVIISAFLASMVAAKPYIGAESFTNVYEKRHLVSTYTCTCNGKVAKGTFTCNTSSHSVNGKGVPANAYNCAGGDCGCCCSAISASEVEPTANLPPTAE